MNFERVGKLILTSVLIDLTWEDNSKVRRNNLAFLSRCIEDGAFTFDELSSWWKITEEHKRVDKLIKELKAFHEDYQERHKQFKQLREASQ